MDNLSHSLAGCSLAETGLKNRTRKGLAACVLAANMPDIDVFFGWAPWAPLATHRGFTHGLVGGVLVLPPLLAGLLWLFDRWQVGRGRDFTGAPPMRFGWLVALCYLAALTHPLLDLQNTYAVQLWSLASTRWFHTDGLFIISPWLLAILGTGIWLSRKRKTGGPAVAAVAGAIGFIGLNIGISALAWHATPGTPDRLFASPGAIAFWHRDMIWRQDGIVSFGEYDIVRNVFTLGEQVPDNMSDPIARRAAVATPEVRKFLAWSQVPVATIRRQGCSAIVSFDDRRYSRLPVRNDFKVSATVPAGC